MTSLQASPDFHDRVGEFAYRCGRVLAVPIAQDRELLDKAHKMAISSDEAGETKFFHLLPPELQLDAVAARSRPLLLKDRCSYKTGLAALRRLIRNSGCEDASEYCDAISDLADGWRNVMNPTGQRYYSASREVEEPEPASSWSEEQLAEAWLYGDLVHATEGHQNTSTRKHRLIAGWAQQAEIIKLARTSLQFVQGFNQHLGLEIPDWAFDAQDHAHGLVSAGSSLGVWMAPVSDDRPNSASIAADLASAIENIAPPSADYEPMRLHPGQTVWVESFPHESWVCCTSG